MYKLLHGDETFLSLRTAKQLLEELNKNCAGYEYITIEAESCEPEEIIRSYETTGMFNSGKTIFIKRLYRNKRKDDITAEVIKFLASSPENIHFLIWEDQKIRSNTKYYKFFKESDSVEEHSTLNKRTFSSWAQKEVESLGLKANKNALYELAQRCNFSAERFINEITKIKLNGDNEINENSLKLATDTFERDIWQLLDSINHGDKASASETLEQLLKQRVDPNFILSMIIRNSRLLLLSKYLSAQKHNFKEIASILKVPPFTLPSLLKSAEKVSYDSLKSLYNRLYNLDYEIKTGNIDPDMGIVLLSTVL